MMVEKNIENLRIRFVKIEEIQKKIATIGKKGKLRRNQKTSKTYKNEEVVDYLVILLEKVLE